MNKHLRNLYIFMIIVLAFMVIANALSNLIPINNLHTDEISKKYETMFTPARYTFSIWSIIYAGLIAFLIFLRRGLKSNQPIFNLLTSQLGIMFLISCMANIAWIIAWHYQQLILTSVFTVLLLMSLIELNVRIYKISNSRKTGADYRWMVVAPFGLYLGWMVIAVVANIAVYFKFLGFEYGLTESAWTSLMIIFSGIIALWLLASLDSISAATGIAWGIIGIYFKQSLYHTPGILLQITILLMIVLIAIGIARIYRKKRILKSS